MEDILRFRQSDPRSIEKLNTFHKTNMMWGYLHRQCCYLFKSERYKC